MGSNTFNDLISQRGARRVPCVALNALRIVQSNFLGYFLVKSSGKNYSTKRWVETNGHMQYKVLRDD